MSPKGDSPLVLFLMVQQEIEIENVETGPRRVLILADGEAPSAALAQRLARQARCVYRRRRRGAQGRHARHHARYFVRRFRQRTSGRGPRRFPNALVVPTPDQDFADLEKAVLLARERGATHIAMLGATGGRMDHTLGNFALLQRYADVFPCAL